MTHTIGNIQFAPGPNLPDASNDAPKKRMPPADMPLPERLRLYSPTSGYARYTAMAADRIDELNAISAALQSENSRLKRILEERNYKVLSLTIANEHHQVNEEKLLARMVEQNRTWEEDYSALEKRLMDADAELEAALGRNLVQTIIHWFKARK